MKHIHTMMYSNGEKIKILTNMIFSIMLFVWYLAEHTKTFFMEEEILKLIKQYFLKKISFKESEIKDILGTFDKLDFKEIED